MHNLVLLLQLLSCDVYWRVVRLGGNVEEVYPVGMSRVGYVVSPLTRAVKKAGV